AIVVDGGDASALSRHDVGGGPPDAARRRRDQRDLALEPHALTPAPLSALHRTLHRPGRSSKGLPLGSAPDMHAPRLALMSPRRGSDPLPGRCSKIRKRIGKGSDPRVGMTPCAISPSAT